MDVRIRVEAVDALDALLRGDADECVEHLQALDATSLLALSSAGYRLSRLATEVRAGARAAMAATEGRA
jgi:ElaB/YqjD/DUF883 family membrane-anchored ribosome-binding protein